MQEPRKYGPASVAITRLLSKKSMGFNEILRALQSKHILGSSSTLSHYLHLLEVQGKIQRKVIHADPPRIVEYTLAERNLKPGEDVFKKLREQVKVTDSVTVTLTDTETGEKRTLTPDKNGNWVTV